MRKVPVPVPSILMSGHSLAELEDELLLLELLDELLDTLLELED
ncbi:hypothetical protein R50076_08270 [Gilvimarinus japonicus]